VVHCYRCASEEALGSTTGRRFHTGDERKSRQGLGPRSPSRSESTLTRLCRVFYHCASCTSGIPFGTRIRGVC
jgi:hypothetical protein